MGVWVIYTTGPEEISKRKKREREKEKRRKKGEQKRKEKNAELRPWQSPITSTRPNTTSRNAKTSKDNTTTSNALIYTTTWFGR
jgi:hypothetical protein